MMLILERRGEFRVKSKDTHGCGEAENKDFTFVVAVHGKVGDLNRDNQLIDHYWLTRWFHAQDHMSSGEAFVMNAVAGILKTCKDQGFSPAKIEVELSPKNESTTFYACEDYK